MLEEKTQMQTLETEDFDTREDELKHLKRFIVYVRELKNLRIFKKEHLQFQKMCEEDAKGVSWDGVNIIDGCILTRNLYNHETDVADQNVKIFR